MRMMEICGAQFSMNAQANQPSPINIGSWPTGQGSANVKRRPAVPGRINYRGCYPQKQKCAGEFRRAGRQVSASAKNRTPAPVNLQAIRQRGP